MPSKRFEIDNIISLKKSTERNSFYVINISCVNVNSFDPINDIIRFKLNEIII